MKTYTVTLTEKEIETLEVCLCGMEITLEDQIKRLQNYEECSQIVKKKHERINKINDLWKKLQRAMDD